MTRHRLSASGSLASSCIMRPFTAAKVSRSINNLLIDLGFEKPRQNCVLTLSSDLHSLGTCALHHPVQKQPGLRD